MPSTVRPVPSNQDTLSSRQAGRNGILGRFLPRLRPLLPYALIYSVVVACYLFYKDRLPDWDEPYYLDFINAIKDLIASHRFTGIFELYRTEKFSGITSLPGYHSLAALVGLRFPDYQALRLVNVGFLVLLTVVFAGIQKRIFGKSDYLKQLCFVFFPVTFTHALLIYTDYPALFFVILAFYLEVAKQYRLSALSLLLGFFVRQNIAPWIVFIPLISYCIQGPPFSEAPGPNLRSLIGLAELRERWLHLLLLAGFAAFVVVNHGVSMGDKQAQPTGVFSIGNILVFYLFSFVFFLPGAIWNIQQNLRKLLASEATVSVLLLAFVGFMFLYKPPVHLYNTWLDHRGTFFIRNNIVHWTMENLAFRVLSFLCAVVGFLEINRTLPNKLAAVMTAAALVSVAPFAVTDIRYAMIPFAFYVTLRNERNAILQRLQTIWLFLISMTWLWGVKMELFTPF